MFWMPYISTQYVPQIGRRIRSAESGSEIWRELHAILESLSVCEKAGACRCCVELIFRSTNHQERMKPWDYHRPLEFSPRWERLAA